MKRRTFVKLTGAAIASAPFVSCTSAAGKAKMLGIQLYTLKEVFSKDIPGTLSLVAKTGFTEVEAYGYSDGKIFGMPYADFSKQANDLGLKVVSGHYLTGQAQPEMIGTLVNDWERAVADAKAAGQAYMVIAWLHPEERETLDGYKKVVELLNKAGETCKQYGLRLAYHNHDFEFMDMGGTVPYGLMLKELDPSLVAMEMDLYWVKLAGKEPLSYFENYPGRFELWHVKDMDKEQRDKNADVGSGAIDFKPIFAKREQSGLKHFFLEQESFVNPLDISIKNGYEYLSKIV
jgi:sugar phosphate isomerase/epimerase